MKKSLLSVLALSLVTTGLAADKQYTVVKGDTLSEITETQLGAPVYGKSGNMQKILNANYEITNPDLILIDQKIQIPFANQAEDEVKVQLASKLKNQLTGNIVANKKSSKWDFALDTRLFTKTLGIQSNKGSQTETTNSGLSYGASGNIYYELGRNTQATLKLGVEKVQYGKKNISVSQNASALSEASLGAQYLWNNKILLGLYGGVKERLVATDLSANLLTIQRKAIGQLGMGTAFVISEAGKNKVALELGGNYFLENSGREFAAEVSIIRSRTTISPFLNYTTMDTKAGQQDNLGTGLNLNYQL